MIVEIARNKPVIEEQSVGIIGYNPSQTARSPKVWNAVYKELGWNKKYYAFDLDEQNLSEFCEFARKNLLGFNVTAPYKEKIITRLEKIDERAKFIGAVNFVKNEEGKLKGYNTDGEGAVKAMYCGEEPFIDTLKGKKIALIGTGGAAKAIAAFVLEENPVCLDIYNRSGKNAEELSEKIRDRNIKSDYKPDYALEKNYDLVINASTKGQAVVIKTKEGFYTTLEPFSALYTACANTKTEPNINEIIKGNLKTIQNNNENSLAWFLESSTTHFFDAVHTPAETVMLQHARWFGRKTMNGKLMNIMQAIGGFLKVHSEVSVEDVQKFFLNVNK